MSITINFTKDFKVFSNNENINDNVKFKSCKMKEQDDFDYKTFKEQNIFQDESKVKIFSEFDKKKEDSISKNELIASDFEIGVLQKLLGGNSGIGHTFLILKSMEMNSSGACQAFIEKLQCGYWKNFQTLSFVLQELGSKANLSFTEKLEFVCDEKLVLIIVKEQIEKLILKTAMCEKQTTSKHIRAFLQDIVFTARKNLIEIEKFKNDIYQLTKSTNIIEHDQNNHEEIF